MKSSVFAVLLVLCGSAWVAEAQSASGSGSFDGSDSSELTTETPGSVTPPSSTPSSTANSTAGTESGSFGGSATGELTTDTETTTTTTTTTLDVPTHVAEISTEVKSVGKAPTKAQLMAEMQTATGGTVVVTLKQTATVPVPDDNGVFCATGGAEATTGILGVSAKGMGKTMTIYGDSSSAPAWDDGCSINPACAATASGRRRQLSSHSFDVNYATEATDDVSQHVRGANFATQLQANIQSEVTADSSVTATIPALTVDHSTIEYTNTVTYTVTTTGAAALDNTQLQGHLTTALSASLAAVGFNSTEVAAMAATALASASFTRPGTTAVTTVSGASTAAVSAAFIAVVGAAVTLFSS